MDPKKLEIVRKKHVDLVSVVLLAFFDEVIEHKLQDNSNYPVVSVDNFLQMLQKLQVLECEEDASQLTSYLSYFTDSKYIDVKKLATATGEFLRN